MLTSIAIHSINRILRRESWARRDLQAFTRKTARVRIVPILTLDIVVDENGTIRNAGLHTVFDTTLTTTLSALLQAFDSQQSIYRYIKISGDSDFAAALIKIAKNVHFDFAQDISHFIGDIPAHRMIQINSALLKCHTHGIRNIAQAIAEYWVEENPELAKHTRINQLSDEIKALSVETGQLEYKIIQLTHKTLF